MCLGMAGTFIAGVGLSINKDLRWEKKQREGGRKGRREAEGEGKGRHKLADLWVFPLVA